MESFKQNFDDAKIELQEAISLAEELGTEKFKDILEDDLQKLEKIIPTEEIDEKAWKKIFNKR